MNGHRTPCRTSAGRHSLLFEQCPLLPAKFLIVLVMLALLVAAPLVIAGCGSDDAAEADAGTTTSTAVQSTFPVTLTDDNGASVTVNAKPERIVSTAPANTETLFALGVGDRVVGVTSLDDYPPEVAGIAKVGDYTANTEAIMALSPDLVVGYSGNEEALAPVQAAGCPVLILNPMDLDGICANITTIGAATGAIGAAADLIAQIKARIEEISAATAATGDSPMVFYALDNTLWTCGPGSFVDELLNIAHCTNVATAASADGAAAQAYFQFSPEQLVAADPDVVLLPGSIYMSVDEFTSDARFAGLKAVEDDAVYVIDDVVVTRPGPRIADGLLILAEAIHPGAF